MLLTLKDGSSLFLDSKSFHTWEPAAYGWVGSFENATTHNRSPCNRRWQSRKRYVELHRQASTSPSHLRDLE